MLLKYLTQFVKNYLLENFALQICNTYLVIILSNKRFQCRYIMLKSKFKVLKCVT